MNRRPLIIAALLLLPTLIAATPSPIPPPPTPPPPAAPVRPVTDDYFGIPVVDPYRYMENLKDPQVQQWIKAQADYTRATLDSIPARAALLADINKYSDSAPARVYSIHRLIGGQYFFLKILAGESIAKLYYRPTLAAPDQLVVDTDKFKGPAGQPAAINDYSPSDDGKYVACSISQGGAEIGAIHVFDVAADKETGESIDRIWGPDIAWRSDNQSFFYRRLQKIGPGMSDQDIELNSRVYLHVVGDLRDQDPPVLGAGLSPQTSLDPIDWPAVSVEPDCNWAIGIVSRGTQNEDRIYVAPAASLAPIAPTTQPDVPWHLLADFDDQVTDLACHGDDVYLLTHKDADRFKIIHTRLDHPDLSHADVFLPEQPGVLVGLTNAADALYVIELDGGIRNVIRIPWGGEPSRLQLPIQGNVGISDSDPRLPGALLSIDSWTVAGSYYDYDPATGAVILTNLQPRGPYDAPSDLTSMEVEAPSYDGTLVPLSIIMKKDLKPDGTNPTILVGYGSYGITLDPGYSPESLSWFERGGILAIAHLRGGGERGEAWHLAGRQLTKPNTWRDMIACAEYLIASGWTSPAHLAASGGSAGGITVGRAITERPDLFAAASLRAGVVNALRSELTPNGPANVPEFGTVKIQEGFEDLYAMDAYHHIRDGVAYPAVMLSIGMNDPRVTPWESVKMCARLQAATSSGRPIFLRVDYANGHGIGASKKQMNEQSADSQSFFLWQFGNAAFAPKQ